MDSYLEELIERYETNPNAWNRRALWGYTRLFAQDDPAIQRAIKLLKG